MRRLDIAHDALDLGYDELRHHGGFESALAASDCRAEVVLAYLHGVASVSGDTATMNGIWHAAETLGLLETRAFNA